MWASSSRNAAPQRESSPAAKAKDGVNGRRSGRRTLRVAIIGCGERGARNGDAARRAQHTSLAVVMDVDETLAQGLGQRLGAPWTTDYQAVLSDDSVDVVFVNTPHYLHAEQAIAAARAGKHVVVEKPLATTLADATRIARAATENGVRLSVWLGMRYLPHVIRAREVVDAGALGNVLGAHLVFHNSKPASYWKGGFSGRGTDWRSRWETCGGGILVMTGIHYLDWLLHLAQLRVTEVSARYATLDSPAEVEDSIAMWLTFENGALATANISSCVQGGRSDIVELRIWGTEGHLSLTPPYQFYSSRLIGSDRPERWNAFGPLPKLAYDNVELALSVEYLERFAQAVLKDEPFDITAEDGLRLQAIMEAVYRSSREGRPITVTHPES